MEYRLLNLQEIEQLTGITFKTIKKRLQHNGVNLVKTKGKSVFYDAREVFPALYASANSNDVAVDLTTEKARLAKAQAEKTNLEAEKLLGTLVDKDVWCNEWSSLLVEFKDKILAVPLKLVPKLKGKNTEEMYEIISRELKGILNELADDSKNKADEIQFEVDSSPDGKNS